MIAYEAVFHWYSSHYSRDKRKFHTGGYRLRYSRGQGAILEAPRRGKIEHILELVLTSAGRRLDLNGKKKADYLYIKYDTLSLHKTA